ncbi:MAG: acyl-CoA thioesterase [Candidatus Bathyarchaeia archaeon]|jgi:acyl-CoA thioester hydrolase|nr:acyl-CoA thioesterase [Candidatus Bathyarchaeota archaeon A05DMB-4]MDH7595550.1 thioesterase family protein [Candidatus Bathyarchaeota archaeon]
MPPFKTTYKISWADTDAAEVVHFSNYFRFFERAEEEMYQKLGFTFNDFIQKYNLWLPRVEALCKFKAPAKFGDILEISLTVDYIKEKSIKYIFTINKKENKQLIAEGYVILVAANKKLGKAVAIPKKFVQKLKTYKKIS